MIISPWQLHLLGIVSYFSRGLVGQIQVICVHEANYCMIIQARYHDISTKKHVADIDLNQQGLCFGWAWLLSFSVGSLAQISHKGV